MTFLDASSPAATAGLPRAVEDVETGTGELVGIGFEKEALDRNYWGGRQRRVGHRQFTVAGDISEALYGDRNAWIGDTAGGTQTPNMQSQLETLFADLEARRGVEPGRLANFPTNLAGLEEFAREQIRVEMRDERAELDRRSENRSSPSLAGGVAEFVGAAGAAVSDIEGLATLPFGAGASSLGRTVLIESLLGAGSEALAIPAYNAQAEFLNREAPDPLQLLLFGATFGAALPLAGTAVREGAGAAVRGARVSNRALLAGIRRVSGSDKSRGAAAAVARDEAAFDSAPAGVSGPDHAADLDRTEAQIENGDPVDGRTQSLEDGAPIADRLMADLQRELQLTPEQAAGIVGNLAHESGGFRHLQEIAPLVPGSRGGFGYAQWTGPRRRAFEAWSVENGLDPRSYEANLGFLLHELRNTSEGAVLPRLRGAQSAADAAQIFSNGFLRPGIPHMQSRLDWTARALGGDIGTVQGPLRARSGLLEADFGNVSLRATDEGFEISAGEITFAQPWAARRSDVSGSDAGLQDQLLELRSQHSAAVALNEDILIAANIEAQRLEGRIAGAIETLKTQRRSTQGKGEKARIRAELRAAQADLQELRALPEITETAETEVLRDQIQQFSEQIADIERQLPAPELRGADEVPAQAAADPVPASSEAAPQAAAQPGPAQPPAVRSATAQDPASAPTNQPGGTGGLRDTGLFDEPADGAGARAQTDLIEADLRARLQADPASDIEVPLSSGEDAGSVRISEILNDHDEEADFLEQLKICMPKGVSNG